MARERLAGDFDDVSRPADVSPWSSDSLARIPVGIRVVTELYYATGRLCSCCSFATERSAQVLSCFGVQKRAI